MKYLLRTFSRLRYPYPDSKGRYHNQRNRNISIISTWYKQLQKCIARQILLFLKVVLWNKTLQSYIVPYLDLVLNCTSFSDILSEKCSYFTYFSLVENLEYLKQKNNKLQGSVSTLPWYLTPNNTLIQNQSRISTQKNKLALLLNVKLEWKCQKHTILTNQ